MKKTVCFVLSVLISLSLFSGCNKKEQVNVFNSGDKSNSDSLSENQDYEPEEVYEDESDYLESETAEEEYVEPEPVDDGKIRIHTDKEVFSRDVYLDAINYILSEYDRDNKLCKKTIHQRNSKFYNSNNTAYYNEFFYLYNYNSRGQMTKETKYLPGEQEFMEYTAWEYDSYGNLTQQAKYNKWNKMVEGTCWEYDENNNKITEKELGSYNKWELSKTWEYSDNTVKEISYRHDAISSVREFVYDENNNLIKNKLHLAEDSKYNENDNNWNEVIYEYDENNNLVKETEYDSYGRVDYYNLYEYDSDNRLVKKIWASSNNGLKENLITFEYNEAGNLTKEIHYKDDGNIDFSKTIKFEYDKNNNFTGKYEGSYTGSYLGTTHEYTYY